MWINCILNLRTENHLPITKRRVLAVMLVTTLVATHSHSPWSSLLRDRNCKLPLGKMLCLLLLGFPTLTKQNKQFAHINICLCKWRTHPIKVVVDLPFSIRWLESQGLQKQRRGWPALSLPPDDIPPRASRWSKGGPTITWLYCKCIKCDLYI